MTEEQRAIRRLHDRLVTAVVIVVVLVELAFLLFLAGVALAAPPPPDSEQYAELHRYAAELNAMRQPDRPEVDCCGIDRDCRRTRIARVDGAWRFYASRRAWAWGDDRWHPVPAEKVRDYDNGVPFVVVCASAGTIYSAGDPFVYCVHNPSGG